MSTDPRILALAEGAEERRRKPATPDDLGQLQEALMTARCPQDRTPHTTNTSHPKGTS